MSKILIVSVSAGSGHVRAAQALQTYLQDDGHEVLNIDLMNFSKPWFKKIYADKYIDIINQHPKIWKFLFDITDKPTSNTIYKTRRWFEYQFHKNFFKILDEFKPDRVISTHFMPPEILIRYKEKSNAKFEINVVVTDFDVHQLWINPKVEHYFVAGELAKNKLMNKNIKEENITISGIPIMPYFFKKYNNLDILEKWNFKKNKKTLLLMAGGAGVGDLDNISEEILKSFSNIQIIALPGKNIEMFNRLNLLKLKYDNLYPISFTNDVHELMYISNLVVTKPGGLSTSECFSLKKPMLLINPIPGQEEFNAKNIESLGVGLLSKNIIEDLKFMLFNLEQYQQKFENLPKYNTEKIIKEFFRRKYEFK